MYNSSVSEKNTDKNTMSQFTRATFESCIPPQPDHSQTSQNTLQTSTVWPATTHFSQHTHFQKSKPDPPLTNHKLAKDTKIQSDFPIINQLEPPNHQFSESFTQHLERCLSNQNFSTENFKDESEDDEKIANRFEIGDCNEIDKLYETTLDSQKSSLQKELKRASLTKDQLDDDSQTMQIECENNNQPRAWLNPLTNDKLLQSKLNNNQFEAPVEPGAFLAMEMEEPEDLNSQRININHLSRTCVSDRQISNQNLKPERKAQPKFQAPQMRSERIVTDGCSCKKSKCLKLYCECFSNQGYCDERCSCDDCYNNIKFSDIRNQFLEELSTKNPTAFLNKIKQVNNWEVQLHSRGCNCKKTGCLKDYCECHAAGVGCTNLCHCQDCANINEDVSDVNLDDFKEKVQRKRRRTDKKFEEILNQKLNDRKITD